MTSSRSPQAGRLAFVLLLAATTLAVVSLRRALTMEFPESSTVNSAAPAAMRPKPRPSTMDRDILLVVARDPFHPERRRPDDRFIPPTDPSVQGAVAVNVPPPAPRAVPRLLGTTVLGSKSFAVLQRDGESARILYVGQSLDGMELKEVQRGKAIIADGDSTLVLELRKSGQ